MTLIPASHADILSRPSFAHIATIGTNGLPQVTPVWIDYDGSCIRFNTARGRVKDRKLQANPAIALSVLDPDNPYRYIGIQGTVIAVTEDGAIEHIHALSRKYTGHDYQHLRDGEVRVIYTIRPERVWTMG
jgi:PPOX class probable F420-dependent enzyme